MSQRLIIDGNAVYEIDEDCMRQQEEKRRQGRQCRGRMEWHSCQEKREREEPADPS